MEKGISLDEACAKNQIGTREDFERNCNPDGSVKQHFQTTTFSLKNDESKSITVDNSYLYIASVAALILVVIVVYLVSRKVSIRIK